MEAIAIFPELIYPKNLTMREDTPGKPVGSKLF